MFKSLITNYVKDQIKAKAVETMWISAETFDSIAWDAIDSMIMWVAKNTETEEWKTGFVEALSKDHDWSLLDDAMGLINQEEPGSKILDHILWGSKTALETKVAESTWVTPEKASSLFNTIALTFMQMMGKQANTWGLDLDNIASLFQTEKKEVASNSNPLLNMFLDKDGDGDVDASDLMGMAAKMMKG